MDHLIDACRIKRFMFFEKKVFKEIAEDPNAFLQGSTLFLGLLVWRSLSDYGPKVLGGIAHSDYWFTYVSWFFERFFWTGVGLIIYLIITVGIVHALARIMGGKASLTGYFSASSYSSLPQFLMIIPFIGNIFLPVSLIYLVVTVKRVYEISVWKAMTILLASGIAVVSLLELFHLS